MRLITRSLLALAFACLLFGAGATRDDPVPCWNTATVKIVFDDTYTTANITLARIEAEVLSDAGISVAVWSLTTGWTVAGGEVTVPIYAQAQTLPNGLYQLRVRVWDAYGNASPWSVMLWVQKQWRDIPAPGGCRIVAQ